MLSLLAILSFETVQGWMDVGGYLAIFTILCVCGLGLPLPEDIPIIIAGAFVACGKMELAPAAAACWLGIIGGDSILYWLSRKYGMGITKVPFVGKHITISRVEMVEKMFDRYGAWVVAVCRVFAGVRTAMVVAAGFTKYGFVKFIIADGLAAFISGGLFLALGYWFGSRLDWLVEQINHWQHLIAGLLLGVAIAAGVGLFLWCRKRRGTPSQLLLDKAVHRIERGASGGPPNGRE